MKRTAPKQPRRQSNRDIPLLFASKTEKIKIYFDNFLQIICYKNIAHI
jgi:hypothetical protein